MQTVLNFSRTLKYENIQKRTIHLNTKKIAAGDTYNNFNLGICGICDLA